MIEMALEDVIVRVGTDDSSKLVWDQRIVVLREKDGQRRLPIWMGPGEGNALALHLREATTPRPVTADLHGAGNGSGMRYRDAPLDVGDKLSEGTQRYLVERVE